jgi:putative drug exporter of the RND superfamily
MFTFLGRVVRRAWLLLLAAWAALVIGTWLSAPAWRDIAQDREFAFLPEDAPSRVADKELAQAFPGDRYSSNIVLVIHRAANDPGRVVGDNQFIEDVLYPSLRKIAEDEGGLTGQPAPSDEPLFADESSPAPPPQQKVKRSIIARIRTPIAPGAGAFLVSADGQAQLIVLDLTTEFLSVDNWPTITKVDNLLHELRQQGKIPQGLDISMTGSAVLGRDHTQAEYQSVRATGALTVILVVVLLILIYRAPLLALIPLITVYLAVQVALNVLALLGKGGYMDLFQGLQVYITILAYGAGVDYCLFLTARYKEELDQGASPADAVARAIGSVGGALTASAATVICGIAMMYFAQFGKFRTAGIAIPLTLVIVLVATLTFSASLLRLAGRWSFWPHRERPRADAAPAKPGWLGGLFQAGELQRIWDRVGQLLLRRAGTVWLATVAFMAPFLVLAGLFHNRLSYDMIVGLPADAPGVVGTRILEQHFPAGVIGPLTVLMVDPRLDFDQPQGREVIRRVTEYLDARKGALHLADVRSLTAPMGFTEASTIDPFAGLNLPPDVSKEATQQGARRHYITSLGQRHYIGARLELVQAQNPFSHNTIDDFKRVQQAVRQAIPEDVGRQTKLYFAGTTPSVHDLAVVMGGDRLRINLLVVVSVFIILMLLLRQLVVTVYLLLSVLFSYYVTLGVTFGLFWLLDPSGFPGLDWKVAMFLFTILIAVGEDYNIFLMTRIHEEERRYGPLRGITQALDRTGPIISSCGIIMAGTFGTLLAGSLGEMKQLGFALAFGVLLDTFVVRPILVPAFLMLLHRGRIPLLRRFVRAPAESTEPAHAGEQR